MKKLLAVLLMGISPHVFAGNITAVDDIKTASPSYVDTDLALRMFPYVTDDKGQKHPNLVIPVGVMVGTVGYWEFCDGPKSAAQWNRDSALLWTAVGLDCLVNWVLFPPKDK